MGPAKQRGAYEDRVALAKQKIAERSQKPQTIVVGKPSLSVMIALGLSSALNDKRYK